MICDVWYKAKQLAFFQVINIYILEPCVKQNLSKSQAQLQSGKLAFALEIDRFNSILETVMVFKQDWRPTI